MSQFLIQDLMSLHDLINNYNNISVDKLENKILYTEITSVDSIYKNIKENDNIILLPKNGNCTCLCNVVSLMPLNNSIYYICNHLQQNESKSWCNCYHLLHKCRIFKYNGPTEEEILKKNEVVQHLNEFVYNAKYEPVEFEEIKISFIGEEYRNGRNKFYEENKFIGAIKL